MTRRKPPIDALDESIAALSSPAGKIHIRQLRFPNYRNLELNAILPFEFPVTVLLGRNGTNKSSILHALYGSVHKNTVADFWFETKLDAIPETHDGVKQSVTHTYVDSAGQEVECIKARAPRRSADPDYWEAVKPTQVYGFQPGTDRAPPISLPVVHLDFRAELSAFDKYFYFPDLKHLSQRAKEARRAGTLRREYRKQDYLRRRSGALKKLLDKRGVPLNRKELAVLRYVLERDYKGGSILTHSVLHGHRARTIRFKTPDFAGGYSDAFAGSGESAATFLVHDVLAAKKGSLILLDEPETSLHPRAQRRMLEFLCHYSVRNGFQVVMATHSPHLAQNLPPSAIRVLEPTESCRIRVSTSHSAREALHEIGHVSAGKEIFVEDRRAKHLLLSALEAASSSAKSDIRVVVRDGGTSRIFHDIMAHSSSGDSKLYIVLDGDHRPEEPLPAAGSLPQGKAELEAIVRNYTKGPNAGGPKLDFVNVAEVARYIEFLRGHVRFLPGQTPEHLVWSEAAAKTVLGLPDLPSSIASEVDAKAQLRLAAEAVPGFDGDGLFQGLVAHFLRSNSTECGELMETVNEIRNHP